MTQSTQAQCTHVKSDKSHSTASSPQKEAETGEGHFAPKVFTTSDNHLSDNSVDHARALEIVLRDNVSSNHRSSELKLDFDKEALYLHTGKHSMARNVPYANSGITADETVIQCILLVERYHRMKLNHETKYGYNSMMRQANLADRSDAPMPAPQKFRRHGISSRDAQAQIE